MIASKIQIYDGAINDLEWNFYLRGGSGSAEVPDKLPSFLTEKTYKDIYDLSNLTPPFKTVLKDALNKDNEHIWKRIV
jgi:hypothetical protein